MSQNVEDFKQSLRSIRSNGNKPHALGVYIQKTTYKLRNK